CALMYARPLESVATARMHASYPVISSGVPVNVSLAPSTTGVPIAAPCDGAPTRTTTPVVACAVTSGPPLALTAADGEPVTVPMFTWPHVPKADPGEVCASRYRWESLATLKIFMIPSAVMTTVGSPVIIGVPVPTRDQLPMPAPSCAALTVMM